MQIQYVGPMPVDAFMSSFLPAHSTSTYDCTGGGSSLFEIDIDLIHALEGPETCPHLQFFDRTKHDHHPHRTLPPIYACNDDVHMDHGSEDSSCDPRSFWRQLELFVDKVTLDEDPFLDPSESDDAKTFDFLDQSPPASARLHLDYSWAYAQLKHQSRMFAFAVLLVDGWARLIRWDRSGAIVTERFAWTGASSPLAEFLRRFDGLSPEQRGHDPTVSVPTQEAAAAAREAFSASPLADVSPDDPLRAFAVRDDVTNEDHAYIVAPPQWYSRTLAGRATFGYIAFDPSTQTLVYLKDTWRIAEAGLQKEGDVYRRLHEQGVLHIAPMLCAGDVDGQRTLTQDFVEEPWACGAAEIVAHQRYRVVLGVVGRPLDSFKSTFELCQAIADAVEAHALAFALLKILHRDISAGNILITEDGRGLLIDWDLCRDLSSPVVLDEPLTGTWQFISGLLLTTPGKEHALSDDLESFVHVLAFHLVHHRPTGFPALESDVYYVYHRRIRLIDDNRTLGGLGKSDFFISAALSPAGFRGHVPRPCAMLLRDLRHLFRDAFYADIDFVEDEERNAFIEALKTPDRVLDIFRTHLAEDGWARDDGSQDDLVGESSRVSTGKRRVPREDIDFVRREPPKKRSRDDVEG
ncbi:hypothetical protein OF83DRAFT_1112345 [Amylostereum chailletii]|nr:hypothetical protein OF83DRAFT_1112345 [Amylostereum chailletii]